jgi:peptidoglycan/xylan/chitin deacetylase (PgdA/CDA1 family)
LRVEAGVRNSSIVFCSMLAAASLAHDGAAQSAPDSVRIPILVYHAIAPHRPEQTTEQRLLDVDPAVFKRQMRYLANHGFRTVSLATLVGVLESGAAPPDHVVIITFDDGWENQYESAVPVLRQLGMTATFFVVTYQIGDPAYMTWNQLRALQDAGMTIGSHTRSHQMLTHPSVLLTDEVEKSREDIQQHLGTTPDFFAYPYGVSDARAIAAVRAAGYAAARVFPNGPWNTPSDVFALRSVLVTDDMDAFEHAVGPP